METQTNPPSPAPAETVAPAPETPSLETIAKELSIEEQAKQFTTSVQPQYQPQYQSQPAYQPPQFQVPDPVTNPEGYNRFMAMQGQMVSGIDATLKTLHEKVSSWETRQLEQKVNQDVDRAVSKVNEKLKVEPMLAEIALEKMYRSDANFKRIWDNRDRNPQALEKALDVVSQKMQTMFNVRQDPQIAENLRAAQSAQRNMSTTKTQSQNDEWANLSEAEFQRKWQMILSGG